MAPASLGLEKPADLARLASDDQLRAQKLRAASDGFEAMFTKMLLESMRKTTSEGLFGRSFSGDVHASLFEEELSRKLAETGALGIADALYRQLAPAAGLDERPNARAAERYRHAGRALEPVDSDRPPEDGEYR